jgi:hypothetical protein
MTNLIWTRAKRIWKDGDVRIIKRFALFPITCRKHWDDRIDIETRWLQTVYVAQQLKQLWDEWWWTNKYFSNEAEYEEHLANEADILEKK